MAAGKVRKVDGGKMETCRPVKIFRRLRNYDYSVFNIFSQTMNLAEWWRAVMPRGCVMLLSGRMRGSLHLQFACSGTHGKLDVKDVVHALVGLDVSLMSP